MDLDMYAEGLLQSYEHPLNIFAWKAKNLL